MGGPSGTVPIPRSSSFSPNGWRRPTLPGGDASTVNMTITTTTHPSAHLHMFSLLTLRLHTHGRECGAGKGPNGTMPSPRLSSFSPNGWRKRTLPGGGESSTTTTTNHRVHFHLFSLLTLRLHTHRRECGAGGGPSGTMPSPRSSSFSPNGWRRRTLGGGESSSTTTTTITASAEVGVGASGPHTPARTRSPILIPGVGKEEGGRCAMGREDAGGEERVSSMPCGYGAGAERPVAQSWAHCQRDDVQVCVCVCVCWRCVTEGRLGEWEQRGRRWRGRMGWGVSVSEGARGGSLARTHPHSHSPTDACTRTERIAFWSGAQHAHTHKNTHKHTGKLTRTCTPTDCAEPQCIPCAA